MDESFWTKKQSCKLSKVDIKKWHSFFVFVCFNGCHFLNRKILENLAGQFFFFFIKKLLVGCHRDNIQRLELAKFLNSFLFFQSTVNAICQVMWLRLGRNVHFKTSRRSSTNLLGQAKFML